MSVRDLYRLMYFNVLDLLLHILLMFAVPFVFVCCYSIFENEKKSVTTAKFDGDCTERNNYSTRLYLVSLSSKTHGFKDKPTKYQSV